MHLPNVYLHRGALFPTFCILVFGEIKFYRNQLLSIVSPSSVDRLKSFLRNDQRFVVGERHLRFSYSSSSLFLKIIPAIFLNFKFPKGEELERKVFDWRKCSVRPSPRVTKVATPEGCRRGLLRSFRGRRGRVTA